MRGKRRAGFAPQSGMCEAWKRMLGKEERKGAERVEVVKVRNVVIGKGKPKICVPIVAVTEDEIMRDAERLCHLPADLAEWRADWYEGAFGVPEVLRISGRLRESLGDLPLLFTFRTSKEGGERAMAPEEYIALNRAVIESGFADLLDIELFTGEKEVEAIIEHAHRHQVKVIVSSHDFRRTPSQETILGRLKRMQELGADISKIAVMPQTTDDVLALLAATLEMSQRHARGPIVTMSMSGAGVISRLAGETFGSAITYGAAGKQSAPGQVPVEELARILNAIHESQEQE